MNSTREMSGLESVEGEKVNTLRIGQLVGRRPEPRYAVRCERCGAETTETHTRLRNGAASCRASNCGKSTKRRDLLTEERRQAAQREAERIAEDRAASERKMAAESEGWERPTRYKPSATEPAIMSERDRLSIREWNDQLEAEQREAERPAREKAERDQQRITELQTEHESTLRQLHAIERERVLNGKDDEFIIDPDTIGPDHAIPNEKVAEWQAGEFAKFLSANPDYFKCDENGSIIANWLSRQAPGMKLVSAKQLEWAFKRLSSFGLLKERPAPVPVRIAPQPKTVNLTISPTPQPSAPETEDGWGGDGTPITLTARQVRALSADDYRRFKRLDKAALALPNAGPGPKGNYEY